MIELDISRQRERTLWCTSDIILLQIIYWSLVFIVPFLWCISISTVFWINSNSNSGYAKYSPELFLESPIKMITSCAFFARSWCVYTLYTFCSNGDKIFSKTTFTSHWRKSVLQLMAKNNIALSYIARGGVVCVCLSFFRITNFVVRQANNLFWKPCILIPLLNPSHNLLPRGKNSTRILTFLVFSAYARITRLYYIPTTSCVSDDSS